MERRSRATTKMDVICRLIDSPRRFFSSLGSMSDSDDHEADVFVNMVEMSHESLRSESLRPRLKRRQPRRQRRKARMAATIERSQRF